MDVTFTLRLINQLTAPAREAKAALNDLVKTAGESAKTAGKSAAEAVTTSANATRDAARKTAEQTGRAAATKAKTAAKTAADAAKAPVSKALKEVAATAKPADPALKPVVLPQPKPSRSMRDFLRDQGDAPAVINDPPVKDPAPKKQARPDKKLGLLSSLPDDAAGEAEKSVGLVGRTVAAAKARLATSVTWHDQAKAKRTPVKESQGEGPDYQLRQTFPSEAEAKAACKAKLAELQRNEADLSFTTQGNPLIGAETKLLLAGISRKLDGDWIVKQARHTIRGGGSGFETQIEAETPGQRKDGKGKGK